MERKWMFTCFLLLSYDCAHALLLPSVLWDPENPIFSETKCLNTSTELFAQWTDEITVLCGNNHLNLYSTTNMKSNQEFNYNVYKTQDLQIFEKRDAKGAELFHTCEANWDKEVKGILVNKKNLVIRKRDDINKTFYFFTTSDGTKGSLQNEIGVRTSRHMRFSLTICDEQDKMCTARRERTTLCIPRDVKKPNPRVGDLPWDQQLQQTFAIILAIATLLVGLTVGSVVTCCYFKRCRQGKKSESEESIFKS